MTVTAFDLGQRYTADFRLVGLNPAKGEARIAFLDDDGIELRGEGSRLTVDLHALEHAFTESIIIIHAPAPVPPAPAA